MYTYMHTYMNTHTLDPLSNNEYVEKHKRPNS